MSFAKSLFLRRAANVDAVWCLAIGFLIYILSLFFLDSSQHKTVFYFIVGLPCLFFVYQNILISLQDRGKFFVFLFIFYFSISAFWSGVDGGVWKAAKYGIYILCLMVAAEALSARFSQQFILRGMVLLGGIAVLCYALSVSLSSIPLTTLVVKRSSLQQMAGWGEDSPITSAINLGVFCLAAWWLLPDCKIHSKLILVFLIAVCMVLMFFTKSRGPLLSLGIVLFLISFFRRTRTDCILLAVLTCSIGGLLVFSNIGEVASARVAAPNYRLEIWNQAFQQIREGWLFGHGFGASADIPIGTRGTVVTHSHSSYMEVLRVGGVVGAGLFIAALWTLSRRALKRPTESFFLAWLLFGMLCLATDGRLILRGPSSEWFEFWVPLFLLYFFTRPETPRERVVI